MIQKRKLGSFSLVIKYIGVGYACSNCGKMKSGVTVYKLIDDQENHMVGFRLCDECQDKGYEVLFTPRDAKSDNKVIRFNTQKEKKAQRERLLRKRQIRLSRQLEAGVAEDIGGTLMPGSGNGTHAKADIRKMGQWRLEHKFTDSKMGYRLKISDLSAVVHHANMFSEWPGLIINFRRLGRIFVTIPYELFLWVVEILNADPTLDKRFKRRVKEPISED